MIAWRRVLGIIPVLVLLTDTMPAGVAGDARGPVIRIRADLWARGDEGLVQHELEHVRQFYRLGMLAVIFNAPIGAWLALHFGSPLLPTQAGLAVGIASLSMHSILYLASRAYRRLAETTAYQEQMRWPDGKGGKLSLEDAASRLAWTRYDLQITIGQARELLRS
jgi:hypothetical protein